MAKSKTPCRYLMDNGEQCPNEALMPDYDTLLCVRHMVDGMHILSLAREHAPEPTEKQKDEWARSAAESTREYQFFSVVYYIRFGDRIKIGTTTDLHSRMKALPVDKLLVTERGDYVLEHRRHRQFKLCRVNGEWFKGDDPELLAHIAALKAQTPARRKALWNGRADTPNNLRVSPKLAG